MARAGGLVCRKMKLKNFYDPKCAGGCGVVPFPSYEHDVNEVETLDVV